jgi:hypothetical protein
MNKTAVTIICSVAGTLAAVLSYQHFQPPVATAQSQSDEVLRRLDRLEKTITVFADMRAAPQPAAPQPMVAAKPPEPLKPEEAKKLAVQREEGIRAGTAVVDQVVSNGRLTQEDGIALAIATAKLDGPDAAKVYAKLSLAINQGRVRPEKDAFSF